MRKTCDPSGLLIMLLRRSQTNSSKGERSLRVYLRSIRRPASAAPARRVLLARGVLREAPALRALGCPARTDSGWEVAALVGATESGATALEATVSVATPSGATESIATDSGGEDAGPISRS